MQDTRSSQRATTVRECFFGRSDIACLRARLTTSHDRKGVIFRAIGHRLLTRAAHNEPRPSGSDSSGVRASLAYARGSQRATTVRERNLDELFFRTPVRLQFRWLSKCQSGGHEQHDQFSLTSASGSASSQTSDSGRLSPFAQLLNALQQLEQSNPQQFQQLTQQIASKLQAAAQSAQSNGDTTKGRIAQPTCAGLH